MLMKAKEKRFIHFLEGSDKHFLIPVYQRNYDWKKEQCSQLFNDLLEVANTKRTHFLGSIVSIYHDDAEDREYLIIDGQQRLTTISLLLLSLFKILNSGIRHADVKKEQIRDEYLVNKYLEDDKKIRLKPVKNDKSAFAALFEQEDDYLQDTNITINYLYFFNRIIDENISIDDLFYAIKQLVIVEIELKNGEDDPQLIFESLNSTGLDLTEADKVRNFVLMKESSTIQEKYYNQYWNKIEINTNYNVSAFIRDYLTLKERVIPNKNKVYFYFKRYVTENVQNNEILLQDLLKFSKYYGKILNAPKTNDKLSIAINKINRLESIVVYPFVMEILDDYDSKVIDEITLISIIEIIVSFVFRRIICEVPTNALNKMFMVMGREIKKYDDYSDNYFEIFKHVITEKRYSQRFPDDDEFFQKMLSKDIYNFQSKNKLFLLEQLENFENREKVNVEELISNNELTIEHIMPQTLTPSWREALGSNYEKIKDTYLNTIGNITLTGYNSSMSNKPFQEKRDMKNGYKESRLFLNRYISELTEWNESTIKARAKVLVKRSIEIWNYPVSEYRFSEDELKLYTLNDDDINFTGEKIVSFKVMEGKEIKVDSWKDFYRRLTKILYDLDPVNFKKIVTEKSFIYNGEIMKDAVKIDDFKLYANLNIESFLSRMRVMLTEIGLGLDELSFIIE